MKTILRNLAAALGLFALTIAASQQSFAQGDLAIFNLKGNVKTCKWVNDQTIYYPYYDKSEIRGISTTYTFSAKKRLTRWDNMPAVGDGGTSLLSYVERDTNGRTATASIVNSIFVPGGGQVTYTYSSAGQVATAKYEDAAAHVTTTYTYDTKGWESKLSISYTFGYEDDDAETLDYYKEMGLVAHTTTITYTYDANAADAKGNWKKRTARASDGRTWQETRTITYYPAATQRR